MSCISSNFSSFFLDSLNDPSEFAKYLSNGENKFSTFEDFQVFGTGSTASYGNTSQQQYSSQQQQFNGSNSSCGTTVTQYNNSNNNNSCSSNSSGGSSSINSNNTAAVAAAAISAGVGHNNHNNSELFNNSIEASNFNHPHLHHQQQQQQQQQHQQQYVGPPPPPNTTTSNTIFHHNNQVPISPHQHPHAPHQAPHPHHHHTSSPQGYATNHPIQRWNSANTQHPNVPTTGAQHFDGSFEFLKYLRHSNDYNTTSGGGGGVGSGTTTNTTATAASSSSNNLAEANDASASSSVAATSSLIDLDTSTSLKPRSARKAAALLSSASRAVAAAAAMDTTLDVFDHDSKHNIFDLHHHITATNSSNSNESMDVSNLAFPSSHLNASNSNTSSEGAAACGSSDFSNLNASVGASSTNAPKPLVNFTVKENFDVHPSHKVEEGIFQHMNKLPSKKKENLKQLGVRFTGQMTLSDKSIVVENFIKFCQEYEITDHRPFLSLNQSGLNKPEQIKFARYLGQGLPSFTLFCIYSNFKNLFCTKRTEIYTKDGYNLPYILDKTKRFLSNTTADLKNISQQQSNDGLDFCPSNNNQNIANAELAKCNIIMPKVLENFMVYENFDVHETHRVEDGVCTHITRLPPKKQELLKQFGIQSNQSVTYYEKYIIIENFNQFCNEYKISDHRPFLDFHESGLPKSEQVKFVRYLGQGLPNLTLNKIYLAFRDILGLNRIEKITVDGYNLDAILKKKKKNLYNRMHATGIS